MYGIIITICIHLCQFFSSLVQISCLVCTHRSNEAVDEFGRNGLHMAAAIGRQEIASYLIDKGWDPSATTHTVSSRHLTCMVEKKPPAAAAAVVDDTSSSHFSHYSLFLPIARQGHTPLHLAATRARYEIVRMILSNEIGKSTVSVVDNEGRTALISSCVELHDDESGRNETSE